MRRRTFVAAALSTPPLARDLARLLRPPASSDAIRVTSPNGAIEIALLPADGSRLTYGVTFRNRPVIEASPLGILVDGVDLGQGVEAGKVDCVVVYKVDRLSRSLLGFARLMETFDRHRVKWSTAALLRP